MPCNQNAFDFVRRNHLIGPLLCDTAEEQKIIHKCLAHTHTHTHKHTHTHTHRHTHTETTTPHTTDNTPPRHKHPPPPSHRMAWSTLKGYFTQTHTHTHTHPA